MKYKIPYDQGEFYPSKQGWLDPIKIASAEYDGFLKCELIMTSELCCETQFDIGYIQKIHLIALGDIYDFAGKWRDVNLSKGGFVFASAKFLPQTMQKFEDELLLKLSNVYTHQQQLIDDAACIHAELLLIHPFREGNGRTARILTSLIFRKFGFQAPDWNKITEEDFDSYVLAVQEATNRNYDPMIRFFSQLF
jgi:cell filamentation protein